MNECWNEGGLRAYLDRELPPDEMTRIAVHLGGCAECHTHYNELAGRAARVAALMESLAAGPVVSLPPRKTPRPKPVIAAVLALAATATLAFVLFPKHAETPKPMAAPHAAPVRPAIEQAEAPAAKPPELSQPRAKSSKRIKPPQVEYYLALDDEPIDTGVVMRVALDGTGVQADVIFDADGRPRAIRTVK